MNSPFPNSHPQPGDDWLDQLLREDARTHVDDAGFTEAFMQKLPARKSPSTQWRRWLPAMLATAAAWVAVGILPGSDVFLDGAADLIASDLTSPRVVAMVGTLVVFLGVMAAAITSER
jgi:hypothetical protein